MPTLRSVSSGLVISVNRPLVLIGRHPSCDISLNSDWVSRRHCVLTEDAGEIVVRDLGSTNGTWINGRRVQRGRLKPGDERSLGHLRFCLERCAENGATLPDRPEPSSRQGRPEIKNRGLEESASCGPAA